jgi:hypothetical protein
VRTTRAPGSAFWLALAGSLTGRWVHVFAQAWLVHALTGSPLWLGAVAAAGALPSLLLAQRAGERVDRGCKQRLLVVTQSTSMLLALALALLSARAPDGSTMTAGIALVALAFGCVAAFDTPALQAWMLERAGHGDDAGPAQTLARHTLLFNATRMAAPLAAAALIGSAGATACFVFNALSFVPMLAVLLRTPSAAPGPAPQPLRMSPRMDDLRATGMHAADMHASDLHPTGPRAPDGHAPDMHATQTRATDLHTTDLHAADAHARSLRAAALRAAPPALRTQHETLPRRDLLRLAALSVLALPSVALLPALASESLALDLLGLGRLTAAVGVGSCAAALLMLLRPALLAQRAQLTPVGCATAGALLLLATVPSLAWVAALLAGAGISSFIALASHAIHADVPPHRRGRASAWHSAGLVGSAPVGHLALGLAAEQWGTANAIVGAALALAALLLLLQRAGSGATQGTPSPSQGAASSAQSAGVGATRPSNSRSLTRMLRPSLRTSDCDCQRDSTRLTVTRVA